LADRAPLFVCIIGTSAGYALCLLVEKRAKMQSQHLLFNHGIDVFISTSYSNEAYYLQYFSCFPEYTKNGF